MIVRGIRCKLCRDKIFSRARHDMRTCSCGSISIDGGFDYIKLESVNIKVLATKKQLYNDWNKRENKYGLIKSIVVDKLNGITLFSRFRFGEKVIIKFNENSVPYTGTIHGIKFTKKEVFYDVEINVESIWVLEDISSLFIKKI